MRTVAALVVLTWSVLGQALADDACRPCHERQAVEFAASAMAGAAQSVDFEREQSGGDRAACRACHAPSADRGVTCRDCHPGDPHGERTAPTTVLCARCHDAPGESTLRAYAVSSARRSGLDCRDCHSRQGRDHSFIGPTAHPDFLNGVARLRLQVKGAAGGMLVAQISHRTGHRLPGGTTGRSVWLRLQGMAAGRQPTWRQDVRFGWETGVEWQDHSIMPDKPVTIVIENAIRDGTRRVEATLVYRFKAGAVEHDDPRQVVLDKAGIDLP
jgi:hypothetical protein